MEVHDALVQLAPAGASAGLARRAPRASLGWLRPASRSCPRTPSANKGRSVLVPLAVLTTRLPARRNAGGRPQRTHFCVGAGHPRP